MADAPAYRDSVATTVARTVVFALSIALLLASVEALDTSGVGVLFPVAMLVLGALADSVVVWLAGARGRDLLRQVGATGFFWLAGLATYGIVAAVDVVWPNGGWILASAVPYLCVAVAAMALLPRTQAIWLWLLASLGTTVLAAGVAGELGMSAPFAGPYIEVAALALAGGSVGALGFYVRSAVGRRLGPRQLAWRLSLVALAVLFSVAVSSAATAFIWRSTVTEGMSSVAAVRAIYAFRVSQELSQAFGEAELASSSATLTAELAHYSELNNVGLAIYDRSAKRVVIAVRRGLPPGSGPDSQEDPVFRPTSLGATETAVVVAAVDLIDTGTPMNPVDLFNLPATARPLGYRKPLQAAEAASSTASTGRAAAAAPDGERLALVVTEPAADWVDWPGPSVSEVSGNVALMFAPWLFLAFVLPCTLGLIALDRRDAAREKLAAAEERARLNRDAHDRVYNRLTALANRLAAQDTAHAPHPTPADEIRRTVSDLQGILGDGVPEQAPFAGAAAQLLADACVDQGRMLSMDVQLEGAALLEGIDPRAGWELQCIVEEALTNASKHGHASHVRVAVTADGAGLVIVIEDDGCGIAAPLGSDGLPAGARGMRGMADRARALGGAMSVETGDGGTTVTVRAPLASS